MTVINANITPVPLYGFHINNNNTQPGTYLLISGVPLLKIRLLSFNMTSTAGIATIQDSTGLIIATLSGQTSTSFTGLQELTTGADLQVVITQATDINCYFTGFIA